MDDKGPHNGENPVGPLPEPAAPAYLPGVRDTLPGGANVPVDLAALMPVGPLAIRPVKSGSADIVAAGRPSAIRAGDVPRKSAATFVAGGKREMDPARKPSVDLRAPLPKAANSLDVRSPVARSSAAKSPDLRRPAPSLPGLVRKAARSTCAAAPKLVARAAWSAAALGVLVLCMLWAKNVAESDVASAYSRLAAAASGNSAEGFAKAAEGARFSFRRASLLLLPARLAADNPLWSHPSVALADRLVRGGLRTSDALSEFAGIARRAQRDSSAAGWKSVAWTEFLAREKPALDRAFNLLSDAESAYAAVDASALPGGADAAAKFASFRTKLAGATRWGGFLSDNWKPLMDALGDSYPVKYLVLNQNRDELRPGGGFPGSVAVADLYRGKLVNLDFKDVYWFDWRLYPYKEKAPAGLDLMRNPDGTPANFGLRDANYYPSFLESARKADFFFQKAGQGSLDGVVGINQGLFEDMLAAVGPVRLPEIGRDISAEDFSLAMSLLVESKSFAKSSPKDILFRFMDEFSKKASAEGKWGACAKAVLSGFADGQIPFAFLRTDLQKALADGSKVTDAWKYDAGDFAYPVFVSISGNKSDRHMEREVFVSRDAADPCKRSFVLEERHAYGAKEAAMVNKWMCDLGLLADAKRAADLERIQGNGENRMYMRLAVPRGSVLLSSEGTTGAPAKKLPDGPKSSFFEWYQYAKPGATSRAVVRYRVPDALCSQPTTVYKQPGLRAKVSVQQRQ